MIDIWKYSIALTCSKKLIMKQVPEPSFTLELKSFRKNNEDIIGKGTDPVLRLRERFADNNYWLHTWSAATTFWQKQVQVSFTQQQKRFTQQTYYEYLLSKPFSRFGFKPNFIFGLGYIHSYCSLYGTFYNLKTSQKRQTCLLERTLGN